MTHCIQEIFAEQAARTPHAIAAVCEDRKITYDQLNRRANQLAHYLRNRGVAPEITVGICAERSLEMLVGLLGILKAGGAYVPLDPSYPNERLSFMLADGGIRIVLTHDHLSQRFIDHNVELISLDNNSGTLSEENPKNQCSSANLAYVMYTSGSTGVPKGVCIPHRGVVRLVKETNYARFDREQVFLQFAPLSFDASTFEIWGSLLNGARLVVMPPGSASLAQLGAAVERYGVTTLWLTAGLFHQMADAELEKLSGLKQLLAGGDVLSPAHVEQVARELNHCQLINGYGPTENTTFTCCYPVKPEESFAGNVPIGFAISNTQVFILDDAMQPVVDGEPGELYIAGDGLARGYLNDASLTAERFVPHPFSAAAGARLYRTGDSVRRIADGPIEFLGRLDQQVKIRGYRIELGEVETALAAHPAVRESVVLARPDAHGNKRLVAYVVQSGFSDLDSRHVEQWQTLYDETYRQTSADASFNTVGWNSSYTGKPIPPDEMREWVDQTVARIRALQPKRVLEIGCGTGLLLFRVAPHCEVYHATDFSAAVIDQLESKTADLSQVKLSQREANDFNGFESESFDLVILNSVTQYFPGIDYLLEVLKGAVKVVKFGGAIFIGDVRNLDLLETFHASVELYKAPDSLSLQELARRVQRAIREEDELLIDPVFFKAATREFEKACSVQVMPKLGQYQNEMTKFRYDVVLSVGDSAIEEDPVADGLNARAPSDSQILNLINEAKPGSTVADLRHALLANSEFIPQRREPQTEQKSWAEYGNQRSQKSTFVSLVPELRAFLQTKLPAYMTPSAFVFLDRLPLTRNGKVDRQALPAPERSRPELAQPYVGPRSHAEEVLASLCADVLGIDRVGIYDDFFECGGHSLLATQVCARIRESLKVELSLREFFIEPKIATLASLIEQCGAASSDDDVITRQARNVAPLSFGQQRLWFMNQLNPATPVHNIPVAIELSGQPDVDILTRCLNEIVRRHESLRTTIHQQDGKPVQVIAPSLTLALPVIDLTKLRRIDHEVEKIKSAEAQKPFDIASGPLLRATLVRLGHNRNILLLTMHHIISDGWSMGVLLRELGALYSAYGTGTEPSLPELTIQYADFAVWQRERLANSLDQQLSFWKQQLEGAPAVLQLPTDRARPAIKTFRGARHSLVLSKQLSNSVRDFSRTRQVTPFMTLLAALSVLLSRYTDQEDIVLGSPIVNRPRTETETLIGFFLNTLALRTRPTKHSTFRELLENTRDMVLGAFANRDLPFEMLVEALNPARDASRTPLFQVFLNFLNFADDRVSLPGLTAESISPAGVWSQPDESWSQFDMTLYAREFEEQLQFILVYNADLFDRARMITMLDQLRLLLDQIVTAPDKQISEYSLVDAESQAKLPDPRMTLSEPRLEPITETIFAQPPDSTAICKGEQKWTYRELASRSDHIARALVADGLRKGEVVAVVGPPGFDLIACMLAVFRSGGVLLTLDPSLPEERRQLMLREAGAKRVLYDGALSGASAAGIELPVIDPNDPAYLFFTSGTTGVPKGVLGCHKGLSHFLKWQREQFAIGPEDACAQLTGLSFDVVLRDIFLPLTSGASLHLPDASESGILSWLERRQITALHTVPTVAQTWLNDVPEGMSLRSLRWAFFAGEPLNDSLIARWRAAFPESGKIVNLYGPTETTLAKCFYVVPDEPLFGVQPVGQPLPETQALVLNSSNNLCGIGEIGEIVIRTPFRTLGYINDEHSGRFQINPFTGVADDLIYRTGDRGRYRPDGTLEILGRLDQQVKIRGVRVEPDEVTALLARHPAVDSCIVIACKDAHNENALAAYVVGDCPTSELRTYLTKHLPPAMVPSFFVIMPELPLTPNGKVDRRALPEPERSLPQPDEFVAPRDQTEQTVADIWSDVLGIKQFSVATDFFELGGHSLLATQIISRLRDTFQIELPVASIFENRTVAELSRLVAEARQQDVKINPPAITILPRERRRRTL
jgi:amino acid adenylation domain-containing protein